MSDAQRENHEKLLATVARINEIEEEVQHDVIAFLTNVAEHVGPSSRFIHKGMTSSDVIDTALAVQMVEAADLLIAGVKAVRLRVGSMRCCNQRRSAVSWMSMYSTPTERQ